MPVEKNIDEHSEEGTQKKSMLINTAVVTVRNPSKRTESICKQLRKILSPDCLFKLETNPKMQDLLDVSPQLLVKQIVYLSEQEMKIACLPAGPTHVFKIIDYQNNFKNFSQEVYSELPFVTTHGKSITKTMFQSFGSVDRHSKRALHFHFKDDLVYIRHFVTSVANLEDKFRVGLKEIGPRLTLKLLESKTGVFPEMKLTKNYMRSFRNRKERR